MMPFLHGFRRIIYEYQPLVDAVLSVLGLDDAHREGGKSPDNEDSICRALEELLERESQSDVFEEGISYALFKMAEVGLVYAAEILLRYGADVNFEDPVSYYNPLHIAVVRNRPNMLRPLVGHGADIEKRDRIHGCSPLDLASEEAESLPCMLALLDLGANVNARDKNGKSALLHALASSDGLTVDNTENIQLLLKSGADVRAITVDGETAESSLVFLVKEALDSSTEAAAEIGHFCLRATQLLLAHGADPCCRNGEPSLTPTSLEHFDLLFPLAVLLLQGGASFVCEYHGASCWSGYSLVFSRLQVALHQCSDESQASELLEQAEVLLDLARASYPTLPLAPRLELPVPGRDPHAQALLDLHKRVAEQEASPPPLHCLCRAFIRTCLQPWPLEDRLKALPLPDSLEDRVKALPLPDRLEDRVKALPLPDRLKEFLLPQHAHSSKPGWDRFRPLHSER